MLLTTRGMLASTPCLGRGGEMSEKKDSDYEGTYEVSSPSGPAGTCKVVFFDKSEDINWPRFWPSKYWSYTKPPLRSRNWIQQRHYLSGVSQQELGMVPRLCSPIVGSHRGANDTDQSQL